MCSPSYSFVVLCRFVVFNSPSLLAIETLSNTDRTCKISICIHLYWPCCAVPPISLVNFQWLTSQLVEAHVVNLSAVQPDESFLHDLDNLNKRFRYLPSISHPANVSEPRIAGRQDEAESWPVLMWTQVVAFAYTLLCSEKGPFPPYSYRLCLSRSRVNSSCRLVLVPEISWFWHVLTIRCLLWHLCSLCKIHSVQRKVSKEILHAYMVFWLSWRQGISQTHPSIFPHMIAEHLCFLVLLSITPPVLCGQSSCPENNLHRFEGVSNVNLNIWHKSLGLQRSAGRWSKGPQWRQGRGKLAKIKRKPQLSPS